MSLVPCRECEKEVSSEAPLCPHCGIKKPGQPEKDKGGSVFASVFVAFVIIAALVSAVVLNNHASKPKTENSRFDSDGSYIPLVAVIKSSMHDPSSFEHVSTRFYGEENQVVMKYRGKNTFGAYVVGTVEADIGEYSGSILDIRKLD